MISQIQLCLRHSGRISGRKRIIFQPGINVIIGPNGSGKSSLIEAVQGCPECRCSSDSKTALHYFSGEKMNPHRNEEFFKGIHGSIIKVRAMFSSHGETMRDVLRFTPLKQGDCFLLDEPETGHDIEWVMKIRRGLEMLAQNGCQIIVASHHPVFWNHANIIELKRGYMKGALQKLNNTSRGQK